MIKVIQKIPEGWNETKFEDLGEFFKGSGITKNDLVQEGVPCIRYAELYTKFNFTIPDCVSFVSEKTAKAAKKIQKGDLLLAGSGETKEEIGKCAVYMGNVPAYAGGDNIIFRANKSIPLYLSFFLNTLGRKQLNKLGQGDSIVHIHSSDLKNVVIPLPPLAEQEKIAEILGTWNSAIEKLTALIAAKRLQKKGLMQKLLTARIRLPDFTGEWTSFEFKNISFLIKEKYSPVSSEHYKCVELEHIEPHSARLLGYVDSSEQHSVKNKFYKKDIIFGKLRPYLKKFYKATFNGVCSTEFWVLRGKNGICLTDFLYWLIQMPEFNAVCNVSSGTHMPRADWNYVSEIPFSIPTDISEQKAIADILSKADEEIDLLTRKLDLLQSQKKGLMQQLLTGKIRVKVA